MEGKREKEKKKVPESKLVVRLVVVGAGGCLASPVAAFASATMAASVLLLMVGEVNDSDTAVSPSDCCPETISIGEDQVKVKVSNTDVK